jgi:hypothetical protein
MQPFKVLCISTCEYNHITLEQKPSPVKEGNPYTVIEVINMFNNTYYALDEIGIETGFIASAFIPLSEVDETSFIRKATTL